MKAAAAALAAVLVLGACDTGPSEQEAMVDTIRTSILRDETFAGYEVGRSEAICVAEATVSGVGVERLADIGFDTPAGSDTEVDLQLLHDEEIDVVGAAMDECIAGIDAVLVDTVAADLVADPSPTLPIDDGQARCAAEAVVSQVPAARLISVSVRSERTGEVGPLRPAELDVFARAYTECFQIRENLLTQVASAGTASPAQLACIDEAITDDDVETIVRADLAGEDAGATFRLLLAPALDACAGA